MLCLLEDIKEWPAWVGEVWQQGGVGHLSDSLRMREGDFLLRNGTTWDSVKIFSKTDKGRILFQH